MKIRIKDIARLANVSPGTVDRVIHNRGEVSETTRHKVSSILQELDYQPDLLASALASKRSYLFSVLMPVSANDSNFWNAPVKGIEKAIKEISPFGVRIKYFLFNQYQRQSFLNEAKALLEDKPDAILFAPVFPKDSVDFIEECIGHEIPVVLFNSNLDDLEGIPYVGQDAIQSGYLGAKLLHFGISSEGDILVLNIAGRKDNHNHIIKRERGFRKYFSEHARGFGITTLEMNQPTEREFQKQLENSLKYIRLKGIFVTNSRVYKVARYLEMHQMDQIRLVGFDLLTDNVDYLKKGVIDFLISQKPEEQGYRGIMTLFDQLIRKQKISGKYHLPIDIITKENIDFYEYR